MCEERLTLAGQTPSPGHLGAARVHTRVQPVSPSRSAFLFLRRAGQRGAERERTPQYAAGLGRLYKLRGAPARFVKGQGFPRAARGLRPRPAAPWRPRSARRAGPASARTGAACSPRPPTAPRGTGARTLGTALHFLYRIPPAHASPAPPLRPRPPLPVPPTARGPRSAATGSAEPGLTSPLRAFAPHPADPEASGDRGWTHEESRRRRRPRSTPRRW